MTASAAKTEYAETIAAIKALTPEQTVVYNAINAALYAEPYFSDVQGEDIAHATGLTAQQVGGYVKALIDAGLVYVEYTDVNMSKRQFIHTHAHDAGLVRDGRIVHPAGSENDYPTEEPAPQPAPAPSAVGIEVHYMDAGYSCLGDSYIRTDETGHHEVAASDVPRSIVTEWLDSSTDGDDAILAHVYAAFQNGVSCLTGIESTSEQLGIRSMMVGDYIVLQTNNRGPKRTYRVAPLGFERVKEAPAPQPAPEPLKWAKVAQGHAAAMAGEGQVHVEYADDDTPGGGHWNLYLTDKYGVIVNEFDVYATMNDGIVMADTLWAQGDLKPERLYEPPAPDDDYTHDPAGNDVPVAPAPKEAS